MNRMTSKIISMLTAISFIGMIFFVPSVVEARRGVGDNVLVASGSVLQSNMRISAVDSVAFVDFSAASVLTDYIGHLLVVKDSSGRMIQGYIKAAGTGETLGSELVGVGNCENSGTYPYDTFDGVTSTGYHAVKTTAGNKHAGSADQVVLTNSMLVKSTFDLVVASGQTPGCGMKTFIAGAVIGFNFGTGILSGGGNVLYGTVTSSTTSVVTFYSTENSEYTVSSLSIKQVLTPSATGVTIVSTKGGSTFNWANKNTSFNYNDSSNYTYQIFKTQAAPVVASGSVTQANTRLDLTTDNAFAWLNGVDLSAYTDGNYMLCLYNATGGHGACGWISSTPAAGETLGSEFVTNSDFDSGDVNWTKETGFTIIDQGAGDYEAVGENVANGNELSQVKTTASIGWLMKNVMVCSDYTDGSLAVGINITGGTLAGNILVGTGTSTVYATTVSTTYKACCIAKTVGSDFKVSSISGKRVTDPPSAASGGVRIVSTKGGATRSWLSKSASFNANDTAGQTYKVIYAPTDEWMGVSWNESADTYARRGTIAGLATGSSPGNTYLPIQSQMKRCVVDDSGVVQYYLCSTDSTLKEDCATPSVLDGTDGQVMVEIPAFYIRYGYSGTTHTWDISLKPASGFTLHPAFVKDGVNVTHRYIGAYEGVLYDTSASRYANCTYQTAWSCTFEEDDDSITANSRTAPFENLEAGDKITVSGTMSNDATFTVASIVSDTKITVSEALTDETAAATVIITQKDWTATTGDKLSSVSGKSAANYGTRAQFRVAASNRGSGWRQLDYDLHSAIQLLYLVEYASFYSQSMIGAGITNVTDWSAYNNYNPIAKAGNSNAIGNATGNNAGSASSATESTKYLSYRGIENWYGHLWKWVDGINVNSNVPYVSNNATQWADDTSTNYTDLGLVLHNADGYQSTLSQMVRGFLPESVGVSSSTKITDYYWQNTGWRVACVSGRAYDGFTAGAFFLFLDRTSGSAYQYIIGRLTR